MDPLEISETEDHIKLYDCLCLHMDKDDRCAAISFIKFPGAQTMEGIHIGSSLEEMIACYGDSYERLVYVHKGIYKVYRYRDEESILEFGFHGTLAGNPTQLSNLEIYHKSVDPIYDYGELLEEY